MVLDVTLAGSYAPGTNLRGRATGASWLFVLPSLELGTVVCLDTPPAATLLGLRQRASVVVVVEPVTRRRRAIAAGADGVTVVGSPSEVPDGAAELVVLSAGAARRTTRDAAAAATVRRLLAPGGVVFADAGIRPGGGRLAGTLTGLVGTTRTHWLTPSHGEVRSAVPADDAAAAGFVLGHGMAARSLDLAELKRSVRRRLGRGRGAGGGGPAAVSPTAGSTTAGSTTAGSTTAGPAPSRVPTGGRRRFGRLRGPAARALDGSQRLLDRVERVVVGTGPLGGIGRRHAVLAGPPGILGDGPPRYLVDAAAAGGVDIARARWAVSAPGEYSSRKVVVLLFGPEPADPLTAVVKLTRDPALNPRLENEGAALRLAAEHGVLGAPRALFEARHGGLALLAQEAVDGRPFDAVSPGRADCPHVLAAVDWLTGLGVRTADRSVPGATVAAAARDLVDRFTAVYASPATERAALDRLVDQLGATVDLPVVLQHGDPGTWNAMVTPAGRPAFLDWEAAEAHGLPLLDLFYFVRTVALIAPDADLTADHGRGFARAFLADTPLRALVVDATRRYCAQVGVPPAAVEPLWALCWVHRALKEATRLPAGRLDRGHWVTVLRESLARRDDLVALLAPDVR